MRNATGTTLKEKSEELAGESEKITDDTRNQNPEELAGERGKKTNTRNQDLEELDGERGKKTDEATRKRTAANSPPPGERGRPSKCNDTRRPSAACERIDSPEELATN